MAPLIRGTRNATTYTVAISGSEYQCKTPTHGAHSRALDLDQCDMVAQHRNAQRIRERDLESRQEQQGTVARARTAADTVAAAGAASADDDEGALVTDDGVVLPPPPAATRGGLMLALPTPSGGWELFDASNSFMPPVGNSPDSTTPRNYQADQEAWRLRTEAQHEGLSLFA